MRLVGRPLRSGTARGVAVVAAESTGPVLKEATRVASVLCARSLPFPPGGPEPLVGWVGAVLEIEQMAHLPSPGPPIVGGLEADIFRDGDPLAVDGGRGEVELGGVQEIRVVTSFLERADGRVLLLRRSDRVGSFRGRWAGVSGYLEEPSPGAQARREIREETGIAAGDLEAVAEGAVVYARDGDRVYAVSPFRFRVSAPRIRLDWEHSEYAWVDPAEISHRDTVPKLDRVWRAVAAPSRGSGSPNP